MKSMDERREKIETLRNGMSEGNGRDKPKVNIILPGDAYYSKLLIPVRFRNAVLCHVVSMYLNNNDHYLPPVFLAIEGRAGEGKTVQAIASCIQYGVSVHYVSASELSGAHEGEAGNKLKRIYDYALERKHSGEKIAILIDDFHMGIATVDENVRKTINSTLLTGYLMNLCQRSEEDKLPIILTGNDFSHVYGPLLRSGRAERFYWEPNYSEKKILVAGIFGNVASHAGGQFDDFFDRCSQATMADFAQLRNDYRREMLAMRLNYYARLDDRAVSGLSAFVERNIRNLDIGTLIRIAKGKGMYREVKRDGYGGADSGTLDGCQCASTPASHGYGNL